MKPYPASALYPTDRQPQVAAEAAGQSQAGPGGGDAPSLSVRRQTRKAKLKRKLWTMVVKATLFFKRLMDSVISL